MTRLGHISRPNVGNMSQQTGMERKREEYKKLSLKQLPLKQVPWGTISAAASNKVLRSENTAIKPKNDFEFCTLQMLLPAHKNDESDYL